MGRRGEEGRGGEGGEGKGKGVAGEACVLWLCFGSGKSSMFDIM